MRLRRFVLLVLFASLAYAVVRYHVFKGVPWERFPLYVLNKVASVAGLVFVGAAPWRRSIEERKSLGNLGAALVAGHLVASVLILNPAYFAKFYVKGADGPTTTLTWQAETSMLAGVVGIVLLGMLCIASIVTSSTSQRDRFSLVPGLGRWILAATAAHVFFMGYAGWWPLSHWAAAGYLPPITLLSFAIATGFIAVRWWRAASPRPVEHREPFEQPEDHAAVSPGLPR